MTYYVNEHGQVVGFVNPGTEAILGTSEDLARANVDAFAKDVQQQFNLSNVEVDPLCLGEEDGRYTFRLAVDGWPVEIDMPGLPLDAVRYLGEPDQNIWDYPRLYVDGSSWVWMYALNQCDPNRLAE